MMLSRCFAAAPRAESLCCKKGLAEPASARYASRDESVELDEDEAMLSQWSSKLRQGVVRHNQSQGALPTLMADPTGLLSQVSSPDGGGGVTSSEMRLRRKVAGASMAGSRAHGGGATGLGTEKGSAQRPRWFRRGSRRNLVADDDASRPANATGSASGTAELDGVVLLRGSLEDRHMTSLQDVLSEALVKVLGPVTGEERAPCRVGVSPGCRSAAEAIEFRFKVILSDPNDLQVALAVLKLEACLGGGKRLLPMLATRLAGEEHGEAACSLALSLEVAPPQDGPLAPSAASSLTLAAAGL